jgi:hypothetical protein
LSLERKGRIGKFAFNFIIVVDWDIHENAAVKAERSSLFEFR